MTNKTKPPRVVWVEVDADDGEPWDVFGGPDAERLAREAVGCWAETSAERYLHESVFDEAISWLWGQANAHLLVAIENKGAAHAEVAAVGKTEAFTDAATMLERLRDGGAA